jgi:hypothetical protein
MAEVYLKSMSHALEVKGTPPEEIKKFEEGVTVACKHMPLLGRISRTLPFA